MKLNNLLLILVLLFLIGCVEEVEQEEVSLDEIKVVVIEPENTVVEKEYAEDYYEEYYYNQKSEKELDEEDEAESYEEEEEVDEEAIEEEPVVEEEPVEEDDCTSGWYITGYYTPDEEDFSGNLIETETDGGMRSFKEDFLDVVKMEGWGKTLQDDYVGYYWESWHINDKDLDAQGNELVQGMVAVETPLISPGSKLTIPTLPSPYNEQIFTATDTGVTGKHIDVYTGEGKEAEEEMYKITGEDNTVCVLG
jgi:3D (Asp-Asp-Asp) domain-containing protein